MYQQVDIQVVEAFRLSGDQLLMNSAAQMAKNWLQASYHAYLSSGLCVVVKRRSKERFVKDMLCSRSTTCRWRPLTSQRPVAAVSMMCKRALAGLTASYSTFSTSTARRSCYTTPLPHTHPLSFYSYLPCILHCSFTDLSFLPPLPLC